MIVWMGSMKLRVVAAPMRWTSPVAQARRGSHRGCRACLWRAFHSALGAEQVFLGDHLEDGADVLGHAAVDQHQAVLEFASAFPGTHRPCPRMRCWGMRRPRLMPNSGSSFGGEHAFRSASFPATRRRNPASRRRSHRAIHPAARAPGRTGVRVPATGRSGRRPDRWPACRR